MIVFFICVCLYPLLLANYTREKNEATNNTSNLEVNTEIHSSTDALIEPALFSSKETIIIETVVDNVEPPIEIEDEDKVENISTSIYISPVKEQETVCKDEDFLAICRVVEAETHGADVKSKIHIVSVILNRVNSPEFPNTIQEVCYQSGQFASRTDVEQSTIEAVYTGLNCGDTVQGALFFCTCKGCWADRNKEYLFTDDVGHSFYK